MNRLSAISFFMLVNLSSFCTLPELIQNDTRNEDFKLQENEKKITAMEEYRFQDIDIEFDEEEIISFQQSKPQSTIIIYARQIGIGLLMRYLALKNYLFETWHHIKKMFV